ncbi:MAG: hypothetical protein Q8P42_16100 [Gallionella sp.]|nr:hypothetical protein [Gallionella sp.]
MNKQFDGLLGNRVRGCVILPGCMKQLGGIKRGLSPINLRCKTVK